MKKKEIRPRVATPSLNPRKFSRDSGARGRDVASQALCVGYRMKFCISTVLYDIANVARGQHTCKSMANVETGALRKREEYGRKWILKMTRIGQISQESCAYREIKLLSWVCYQGEFS